MSAFQGLVLRFILLAILVGTNLCLFPGCRSVSMQREQRAKDPWICPEYADLPLREGHFEEAIKRHLKVLSEEPQNALAHYHLGYAYGQSSANAEEVAEYLCAVDLGLVRVDLFLNLGLAYLELAEYGLAEQALRRAVKMAPDESDSHEALGLAYYYQGYYHEAIASCRHATMLAPDDPDGWHCVALALAATGELEESRTAVEHLRRLRPGYPLAPVLLDLFPSENK